MNTKSSLHEIANGANAVKQARSEPIQQQSTPRQQMDFIRSLILDIPVQAQIEVPDQPLKEDQDPIDNVSFDIPTLIRVFELVREGIKSDVELHNLVERIVALKDKGVLTMQDYADIAGGNPQGTERETDTVTSAPPAGDEQYESIGSLQKLAGIK